MLNQEQKEILSGFGQKIVDQLKTDIKEKRVTRYGAVNASGDLAKSVRYEVTDRALKVFAEDYIYYLEYGRNKNKNQSQEALKKWVGWAGSTFLKDWVEDKGIAASPFAVAWKIARHGTTAWEQGGTDLVSGVVNTELINEILASLSDMIALEISSDILKAYKIDK